MPYSGIDVSKHNGKVDWPTAKAAGLNFAMIRCGYGSDMASQDDQQWERNVKECDRLGIPWGAYLYSYALNANDAKSELQHALRLLKGKKPTYPVFIDMEDADGYKANQFWYARPGVSKPDLSCDIWQNNFPETGGKWPGANISGSGCDTNIAYTNYTATTTPAAAPNGAAYTSDTTGKLSIVAGGMYVLAVTCAAGLPSVVPGNGAVVDVSRSAIDGNKYYFKITAKGQVGESTGIYINGSDDHVHLHLGHHDAHAAQSR